MKSLKSIATLAILLLISACGSAPEKPPYTGIKLGKPYEIYGRWYKPHYDKDYDEIGMASWYGPGFHGGKTANGERYDQNALTGAHRTLPMPSIVRVTNLDNGVSALVKINDRGPFAHDRIIDLSKAAAVKLGVFKTGTAKVRVQFLERETREYVENLQNGSHYAMNNLKKVDPSDAGVHEEQRQEKLAAGEAQPAPAGAAEPVTLPANANEAPAPAMAAQTLQSQPAAVAPVPSPAPAAQTDIFTSVEYLSAQAADNAQSSGTASPVVSQGNTPNGSYMVQAGTFGMEVNANHLRDRLFSAGNVKVIEVLINSRKFYRVMMGPYNMQPDARNVLSKLTAMGISDAKIIRN